MKTVFVTSTIAGAIALAACGKQPYIVCQPAWHWEPRNKLWGSFKPEEDKPRKLVCDPLPTMFGHQRGWLPHEWQMTGRLESGQVMVIGYVSHEDCNADVPTQAKEFGISGATCERVPPDPDCLNTTPPGYCPTNP